MFTTYKFKTEPFDCKYMTFSFMTIAVFAICHVYDIFVIGIQLKKFDHENEGQCQD